jgi:acyl carrier protein
MNMVEDVKTILSKTLSLGPRGETFTEATLLLGSVPELDSMSVVNVITALEDHFGISVADDEISADTFATLGSLASFVQTKINN